MPGSLANAPPAVSGPTSVPTASALTGNALATGVKVSRASAPLTENASSVADCPLARSALVTINVAALFPLPPWARAKADVPPPPTVNAGLEANRNGDGSVKVRVVPRLSGWVVTV